MVVALSVAIVLGVPHLCERARRSLAGVLVVAAVLAAGVGNVLVDRASWKLDALNRPVYALFAHVPRFSDLAFSQNGLAAVLVLTIPFGVALAVRSRFLAGAASAGLLLELLVTESRSAILSLGLASALLVLFLRGRRRWFALALPALALALLASGLVALPVSLSWLPTGASSAERLAIWQSALLMIADMPLTGIGLGMFQRVYPLYILPAYHTIHPHAHNLFLQTYLDAGPLGCAGMVLLSAAAVAAIVRLNRGARAEPAAVAAAVSWAAVFLHGQVDSYFAGDPRTYFLMFLPLALLLASAPAPVWRPRAVVAGCMMASGLVVMAGPGIMPAFWDNLGSVERLQGKNGAAAAHFERALAFQPGNWVAERGLGLLGSPAWLHQAIEDGAPGELVHAELARTLPPSSAVAEWRAAEGAPYLARQAAATADASDRERLLLMALQVDPAEADAKRQLAELYLSEARYPKARAVLEGWEGGSYPQLLLGLMDGWLDGNREQAVRKLRLVEQEYPNDDSLANAVAEMIRQRPRRPGSDALGRAYEALGMYGQARAEFARVADPIGHYDLGRLWLEEGQVNAGIAELRLAVRAISNQEDFRLALARVYVRAGEVAEGRRQYQAVLGLDPGNREALGALGEPLVAGGCWDGPTRPGGCLA